MECRFINIYLIFLTKVLFIAIKAKGIEKDTFKTFKHLRKTKHTHHPVDDAKGNAEALLTMKKEFGLKIKF